MRAGACPTLAHPRLEELELLMTRETVRDAPQYHIMRQGGNGAGPHLRQLSDYPHPYPALRDLQKEVIRCPCCSRPKRKCPAPVHASSRPLHAHPELAWPGQEMQPTAWWAFLLVSLCAGQ